MYPTRVLRQAVEQQQRTPLIKFIGKRSPPNPSSSPSPPTTHPASPSPTLPDSFVSYRSKAQQHGPLGHRAAQSQSLFPPPPSRSPSHSPSSSSSSSSSSWTSSQSQHQLGRIGSHSGRSLGSVQPPEGQYFDRSELPERFRRMEWTEAEIEAVGSGGATVVV